MGFRATHERRLKFSEAVGPNGGAMNANKWRDGQFLGTKNAWSTTTLWRTHGGCNLFS